MSAVVEMCEWAKDSWLNFKSPVSFSLFDIRRGRCKLGRTGLFSIKSKSLATAKSCVILLLLLTTTSIARRRSPGGVTKVWRNMKSLYGQLLIRHCVKYQPDICEAKGRRS